jgi:hypothetical protein
MSVLPYWLTMKFWMAQLTALPFPKATGFNEPIVTVEAQFQKHPS